MTKQDLINIIASLKTDFSQDELAYLALTSKAEGVLRDAIAYRMHIAPSPSKKHLVCREYYNNNSRFDIAVVSSASNIETLIELKSHNSIDPPYDLWPPIGGHEYPNKMIKDIVRMLNVANNNTDMYFVFLNNFISDSLPPIPTKLLPSLGKYQKQLNYNIGKSYVDKINEIIGNWVNILKMLQLPLAFTSFVEIKAGDYYEIPVSVLAFIYGPFKKNNIEEIGEEDIYPKDEDFNSLKIILENEDLVEEIRQQVRSLYNKENKVELNKTDSNYKAPTSEKLKIKKNDKTFDIINFKDDSKGLRVGQEVKFIHNKTDVIGKIVRMFSFYENKNREEAKIFDKNNKRYYKFEKYLIPISNPTP